MHYNEKEKYDLCYRIKMELINDQSNNELGNYTFPTHLYSNTIDLELKWNH